MAPHPIIRSISSLKAASTVGRPVLRPLPSPPIFFRRSKFSEINWLKCSLALNPFMFQLTCPAAPLRLGALANTGELQAYNINSNQITGSALIGTVGLDWQFSGVGNLSSVPGESDLLLRNSSTGGLQVYNINNNQLTSSAFIGTVGVDWEFAASLPSAPQAPATWYCATTPLANSRSTTSPTIRSPDPRRWVRLVGQCRCTFELARSEP
jgi:hypothetical protein